MLLSELPFDKHKISWIQLITKYFKAQDTLNKVTESNCNCFMFLKRLNYDYGFMSCV